MKVLALVLLLAVGSWAAPTSELQQIRSVVSVYVDQVKEGAKKALDHLDGTVYSGYKEQLKQSLDNAHQQLQEMQAVAIPYTDSVVGQIMESTAGVRSAINADIEALKADLEPKRVHLNDVINRHIADYQARMDPIIQDYSATHKAEMDALKKRLEPVMTQLQERVTTNLEETKAAIAPMVDSVRNKVNERLENLRESIKPYVDEYKEQLKVVYQQARERAATLNADEIQTQVSQLKEQAAPMAEDFKNKIIALYETLSASLQPN